MDRVISDHLVRNTTRNKKKEKEREICFSIVLIQEDNWSKVFSGYKKKVLSTVPEGGGGCELGVDVGLGQHGVTPNQ